MGKFKIKRGTGKEPVLTLLSDSYSELKITFIQDKYAYNIPVVLKLKTVDSNYFHFHFHFYFIFNLFFLILFLTRVRVKVTKITHQLHHIIWSQVTRYMEEGRRF